MGRECNNVFAKSILEKDIIISTHEDLYIIFWEY